MSENHKQLVSTARVTGIMYLLMAITGILGFLIIHPQVFIPDDAQETLTNLIEKESLARIRLLLEFAIVLTQALTAVWFYKLFRKISEWGAWAIGAWGMVNAVAIMISGIVMASTIDISNSTAYSTEDKLLMMQILQGISSDSWGAGGMFFGLWLIPMGYIVNSTKRMPIWLGRTLIIGGIGYVLSTILNYAGMDDTYLTYLTLPATIGEFWMIGYLLVFGIRPNESYK